MKVEYAKRSNVGSCNFCDTAIHNPGAQEHVFVLSSECGRKESRICGDCLAGLHEKAVFAAMKYDGSR